MSRLSPSRIHLSYANVMSTVGVFIALGGTSYAVAQLPKNSVGAKQLRANAVTGDKVQDGTIARGDLAPDAVASGPRGPRGESGPAGPAGKDGATGPAGASAAPEAWKAFPLPAGWANSTVNGTALQTMQFRKDAFGRVELRGSATYVLGALAPTAGFGALPAGYRPAATRVFTVGTGGGTTNRPAQLAINNDGTFHLYGAAEGEPDFVAFDGVRFETD